MKIDGTPVPSLPDPSLLSSLSTSARESRRVATPRRFVIVELTFQGSQDPYSLGGTLVWSSRGSSGGRDLCLYVQFALTVSDPLVEFRACFVSHIGCKTVENQVLADRIESTGGN